MALGTTTLVGRDQWGTRKVRIYDVQPTSGANYTTGGETISPSQVGLKTIHFADLQSNDAAASRIFAWDQANGKLKVFTALSTEAAAASNQSAFTIRMVFVGR